MIGDKPIHAIETPVFSKWLLDHCDSIPVHLLSRSERHSAEAKTLAKIAMNLIEPGQCLLTIGRNINAGNSANEGVADSSESLEGREKFQR